jgi:hypothetical protein
MHNVRPVRGAQPLFVGGAFRRQPGLPGAGEAAAFVVQQLGDAEVRRLDLSVGGDVDVRGFGIPAHHQLQQWFAPGGV